MGKPADLEQLSLWPDTMGWMDIEEHIKTNLQVVNERIAAAAARSGRDFGDIRLVVVSKAQPLDVVQAAVAAGVRDLGENYPEEALAKMQVLDAADITWHMIGHLQSRKARIVCEYFDWMHSLDSLRLAEKLERLLSESGRQLPVLLEFNVGGEESKSGWLAVDETAWSGLLEEIIRITQFPHLVIKGLMTMPPLTSSPDQARAYFRKLVKLQHYLSVQVPQADWRELSIGTTVDFEVAIEEGATIVRIGSAILGPRPAKQRA